MPLNKFKYLVAETWCENIKREREPKTYTKSRRTKQLKKWYKNGCLIEKPNWNTTGKH